MAEMMRRNKDSEPAIRSETVLTRKIHGRLADVEQTVEMT